jgi:pantetheine-phosphate adenylyltransferase
MKAIYAFSGDPITFGHIDIIERAAKVFTKVLVCIGSNPDKKYMFTLEQRLQMAQDALSSIKNVDVKSFSGLLVDFAFEQNISVIIKGVRNTTDFEYENTLHAVGESQKLGIETFILFAKPQLAHVSSSTVKSIQKEHGFIHEYVTLNVKEALEKQMSKQLIIGVTGEIAAGKSYVTDALVSLLDKSKIEAHNIDLDIIAHEILGSLKLPQYVEVRHKISARFGETIKDLYDSINRKKLGAIVFKDSNALKDLNDIMRDSILVRIKRELNNKEGIIFLNAALLVEAGMTDLCNNNVILVKCDKVVQRSRLYKRGLSTVQLNKRLKSQYSYDEKKAVLAERIREHNKYTGNIFIVDTSKNDSDIINTAKLLSNLQSGDSKGLWKNKFLTL